MRILAIDPGNEESGYVVIEAGSCRPIAIGKKENHTLREMICGGQFSDVDHISIEMIKSYGMPVGATVFETCVWIGRFFQLFALAGIDPDLVYRGDVKLHHCHNSGAKDSNVVMALRDRFAPGVRNHGKGTIDAPGWFYGFRADIWQAYALAVYTADTANAPANVRPAVRVSGAQGVAQCDHADLECPPGTCDWSGRDGRDG